MAGKTVCERNRFVPGFLSVALILSLLAAQPAEATWSIVIVDTETREVAVGSATCLVGFDLEHELPMILVGIGGACAQSMVDVGAINRMRIHDFMLAGLSPEEIIAELAQLDPQHQSRQYGIVDTQGRAATFTGSEAGAFADGVVGSIGTLVYAIQGNVLTGAPVVQLAEQAVRDTPGDLPAKLMAGMEAARSMGGDGRCSCEPADPTGCGAPPESFEKSAHVGFMVVARPGDTDGPCSGATGCAAGDYFMNFNVPNQQMDDFDPVWQLQLLFDAWRAEQVGRPDGVHTRVSFDPPLLPADEPGSTMMTLEVLDWRGQPVDGELLAIEIAHEDNSDQITAIPGEPPVHLGGGVFQLALTGNGPEGLDRFRVTIDDGIRPVVLTPSPFLRYTSDCNANGIDDATDIQDLTSPDCNGNGVPDECEIDVDSAAPGGPFWCTENCNPDCNENGIPDACDTDSGASDDCNSNSVPDECEPDCNENGIPDTCDIADGTSIDSDGDGVPNECDMRFVMQTASGANDGTSWADAYTHLQDALNDAAGSLGAIKQIWVAAGVYKPGQVGDARTVTFNLPRGVAVYGGFAGTEDFADQRDPATNVTILSGDLAGNDGPDFANYDENAHNVVTAHVISADTILDGFTIRSGRAELGVTGHTSGGGLNAFLSTLTVRNCVFLANRAHLGGAISTVAGGPSFMNCSFTGNRSDSNGGACLFNDSATQVIGGLFTGNSASGSGGAVLDTGSSVFVNCTLGNNVAGSITGGLRLYSDATVTNSILWGNSDSSGTGFYAQITLTSSDQLSFSCVQGWTESFGGMGNIGADPLYVDPDGDDDTPGTVDDNLRLSGGSPCINKADNYEPLLPSVDLDGNDRLQVCRVDMGAYESPEAPSTFPDCNDNGEDDDCEIFDGVAEDCNFNHVPDSCDLDDGTSQDINENGVPDECDPDCNENGVPDDYDIQTGVSEDCNENEIPDECDIASGTSEDCSGNLIPDECEPDCNENGTADSCDIMDGFSEDCNENEQPDECDVADGTSRDWNENLVPDECECEGLACCDLLPGAAVCLGDANGDGWVAPADVGLIKFFYGATADELLCRYDIDCSGAINPNDVGLTKLYYGECGSTPPCFRNP
jgi:hypothetical protein